MSNRIPKKPPETLMEFAQLGLGNLSESSLDEILKKLQQAGIAIKDPHEKLSVQIKGQLLAFFRGKTAIDPVVKKTRVSNLKSSAGSATKVTITTISRRSKQSTNESTKQDEDESLTDRITKKSNVTNEESDKNTSIDPSNLESTALESLPGASDKKQKVVLSKKKTKLIPVIKSVKRSKNKANDLLDEEDAIEPRPSVTASSKAETPVTQHSRSFTQTFEKPIQRIAQDIWIPEHITVIDLARKMNIKDVEVMAHLKKIGVSVEYYNELIDQDTAILLVEEMGHRPLLHNNEEITLRENIDKQMSEVTTRPPIITIMGHVDHGKTSLLDYIRRTKVVTKEAGGITQHIAAYHVETPKGVITFLDTPGHATFTAMRARGARLTDIVALVVAADDGVMPQTVEAIEHAQAANVPIVVVVNKMDKPGGTMDGVQQGLAKYNLIPEDWGGDTQFIPVSAKTGDGIDSLLDALLLQAEISELKAPTKGPAQGTIIESRLDKGQGPVATMIVQKGTLKKGDVLLAGTSIGRIKLLKDENGKSITSATPSIPVEILGLSSPPLAGEEAMVVPSERKAREIAKARTIVIQASPELQTYKQLSVEALMDPLKNQRHQSIYIILKADVQGSAEAIKEALSKLSNEEVTIVLLMTGVGTITESDVNLAIASKAVIFGFNVNANSMAKRLIQQEKIAIHYYSIIYELLDEAKKMVTGLLQPQIQETILGKATVREIFRTTKTGTVAGCIVTEGSIHSNHNIRVIRNQAVLYKGKLHSLRRFKDDVKEVNPGAECGISIKNYTDLQVSDIIESYERVEIAREG